MDGEMALVAHVPEGESSVRAWGGADKHAAQEAAGRDSGASHAVLTPVTNSRLADEQAAVVGCPRAAEHLDGDALKRIPVLDFDAGEVGDVGLTGADRKYRTVLEGVGCDFLRGLGRRVVKDTDLVGGPIDADLEGPIAIHVLVAGEWIRLARPWLANYILSGHRGGGDEGEG